MSLVVSLIPGIVFADESDSEVSGEVDSSYQIESEDSKIENEFNNLDSLDAEQNDDTSQVQTEDNDTNNAESQELDITEQTKEITLKTSDEAIKNKTIYVPYFQSETGKKKKIGLYIKDFNTLFQDNTKVDLTLAKLSLLTTMSTMNTFTCRYKWCGGNKKSHVIWDEDTVYNYFRDELGFRGEFWGCFHKENTSKDNLVSYLIDYRYITQNGKEVPLVAIAIRSGAYGGEWYSNGQVEGSPAFLNHKGFSQASDDIIDLTKEYLSEYGINKNNCVFWVTGFSRGGAVANLTGKKLVSNGLVKSSNLFCYTFATPLTTQNKNTSQQGIINIINPLDIVPNVPFNKWGFNCYGTNMYLPSPANSNYKKSVKPKLNETFNVISDSTYKTYNAHLMVKSSLISTLAKYISTESDYYKNWQKNVSTALYNFMGGVSDKYDIVGFFKGIGIELIKGRHVIASTSGIKFSIAMNLINLDSVGYADLLKGEKSGLMMQHWPETYYALLSTGQLYSSYGYKTLKVKCPVDVYVYDKATDELVAKIENDDYETFQNEHPEISLETFVDEKGEKRVLIPDDSDYRIEIIARDDGKMNYSVSEYKNGEEIDKKVVYQNVPIAESDEFDADVSEGASETSSEYNLIKNDTEEIEYTEELVGDNIENIEIDANVEGVGAVAGTGIYSKGDSVVLIAVTDTTSEFEGWYENGTLLSTEDSFGFIADESRVITAKFKLLLKPALKFKSSNVTKTYGGTSFRNALSVTTDGEISYKSSNTKVATVNSEGETFIKGVGTATITASSSRGEEYMPGKITYKLKVRPKGTTQYTPKKAKKAFTAKWKKQTAKMSTSRITGYQVRYSTSSKMKTYRIKTVKGYSKTSVKVSKLKGGKKYYVQVRTYKTVNGVKYYSTWSKSKSVKTKR